MNPIRGDNLIAPALIPAPLRDLIPARHLKQATITSAPVVVIMGDSIGTEAPTVTHDETESLWGQIQRKLCQENPDRAFTFHNRAIGGATWTNGAASTLASTGLTLPDWAAGDAGAQSWIAYVMALNPTVLIFHFGMNDAQNFGAHQLKAVVQAILAYPTPPALIFVTPMVPARNTANTSISSAASQSGRPYNAHYVRTYARRNGHGIIDIGRYQACAVQGFDPCQTSMAGGVATVRTLNSGNSYTYTAPSTQADVGMKIAFTASVGFWSGTRLRLALSMSAPAAPNCYSFAEVYDNAGFVALDIVTRTGSTDIDRVTVTSAITTPNSGAQTLTLFFKDGWASVKLGGVTIYEGLCVRLGGTFTPTLTITGASDSTSLTITDYPATYAACLTMLTDLQMWGDPNVGGGIEGANDLNHPTSLGWAQVVSRVIDPIDLHIPSYNEGATIYPTTQGRAMGVGTDAPLAPLHLRKGASGGAYVNVGGRSVLVVEDTTLALVQLLTGPAGAAGVEMGPATNPNEGGMIYTAGTGNITIRADDLDAAAVLNPGSSSQAGLQVLVNRSGTVTLSQVTVGATDSGGAGFRVLNVPN